MAFHFVLKYSISKSSLQPYHTFYFYPNLIIDPNFVHVIIITMLKQLFV